MNSTWIDISIPVTEAILSWPSDPVYKQKKFASFDSGKPCDASEVSMSVHTGTHIDAPSHFIQNGKTMDSWTPESTIGKCRVIEIEDSKEVTDSELLKHAIQKGERILFRTKNSSSKWWEKSFNENFICISPGAAAYLAKVKPLCIGIDYLSIAPYCFTLYPYKWDVDGLIRRESPNDIWRCVVPQAEAPTALQFTGITTASAEGSNIQLAWDAPEKGIFSHFEVFYARPGVSFSWGDAISQAGNNFNYVNYGRRMVPAGTNQVVLDGFANGVYIFGVITYYTFVTDSGAVTIRSETNASIKSCTVDNTILASVNCL